MRVAWLFLGVALLASGARAADTCEGVAVADATADGNPAAILKSGTHLQAVAQYRVPKHGGDALYCQHGGSCYPASALKLLHCKVAKKTVFSDDEADIFPVLGPR